METQLYSGIVLNQNQPPSTNSDFLTFTSGTSTPTDGLYPDPSLFPAASIFPGQGVTVGTGSSYYQTFQLPSDYARGPQPVVPPLTGVQVFSQVSTPTTATLTWSLEQSVNGQWSLLAEGVASGTAQPGQVWFTAYFDEPVTLDASAAASTYRLQFGGTDGLDGIYYSTPTPINGTAYQNDGFTPITATGGEPVTIMFRVLGAVADSGTDFLGNLYRSVVTSNEPSNVNVLGSPDQQGYWMSAPCPSQFGVASLYFDERDSSGSAVVIDRLTVAPVTPGVYFNIYYSNDPTGPGTDPASWANLLWTPVYTQFQLNRRQTYVLPEPIYAKYIKIEFTQLQARPYTPGSFDKPSTFNKYPQWVLDYFLARFIQRGVELNVDQIAVTYDALDLAFSYYSDDIVQAPTAPALATSTPSPNINYVNADTNSIDPNTLAQISYAFQPFLSQPAVMGTLGSIIGQYASSIATNNYSTESIVTAVADTTVVSNLQREPLLVEKGFPVMFFYVPCRHAYRVSQAAFENGVAYYAGVSEVTFHRDVYNQPADTPQYNEPMNDTANGAWTGTVLPLPPGT